MCCLFKILTIVNSYTYNKTIVHPHIDIMANVFKPYQPNKPAKKNETNKISVRAFNFFQSFKVVDYSNKYNFLSKISCHTITQLKLFFVVVFFLVHLDD